MSTPEPRTPEEVEALEPADRVDAYLAVHRALQERLGS